MRVLLAYLPAVLWAVALLFVGGQSEISAPSLPIPHQDKALHFFAYGLLGVLTALGRLSAGFRPLRSWPLVVGLAGIGAMDELHQATVPGRSAEIVDWVADSLGAVAFYALVTWRLGRRRRRPASRAWRG